MASTRYNIGFSGAHNDALSAANTGFTGIVNTGGSGVLSNAESNPVGSLSAVMTASNASGGHYGQKTGMSSTSFNFDLLFKVKSAPSGVVPFGWGGAGSQEWSIERNADGTFTLRDDNNGNAWTSSFIAALNVWVWMRGFIVQSATVGQMRLQFSLASTPSVIADDSNLLSNKVTGGSAYTDLRLGPKCSTSTNTGTIAIGSWSFDPVATGLVPVYNPNTAPTANAGPDQTKLPGTICQLDGTGSTDPEGNPLNYLWTPPAGITLSSNTASQPTFVVPYSMTQQVYNIGLVVTDSGGLPSATDQVAITVPPHQEWYHTGSAWRPEIISYA